MFSLIKLVDKKFSTLIVVQLVLLIGFNQSWYKSADAQFFGTGSSRHDHDAQEVVKEMAQEFTEIIEDKE